MSYLKTRKAMLRVVTKMKEQKQIKKMKFVKKRKVKMNILVTPDLTPTLKMIL